MKHLLLIRFSALGDILMTIPVIEALSRQNPDLQITIVSRPFVGSVFALLPSNVHFIGINPREYKGIYGLWRMFLELRKLHPTHIADLHDVLRTKILRCFFTLWNYPVSHIIKDRKARKSFLNSQVKIQQETSFERYKKAINKLGFEFELKPQPLQLFECRTKSYVRRIGIAPFAAHTGKIYPLKQMEKVVSILSSKDIEVYLFGAGVEEKAKMEAWAAKYPHVHSVVGTLGNMAAELQLMSTLDAVLTMDSGNMHLAALTSTPVFSIWGATHPLGGFLAWNCNKDHVIQREDLRCRPCSIFGNKPCKFGDYRCLKGISPDEITNKILG